MDKRKLAQMASKAPKAKKSRTSAGLQGSGSSSYRYVSDERSVSTEIWSRPFPINGQGTLMFNTDRKDLPFYVNVEDDKSDYWIALHVGNGFAAFLRHAPTDDHPVELTRVSGAEFGVEDGQLTYWYSYDRDNLVLKYGKGYHMVETTLMIHNFLAGVTDPDEQERIREELFPYFNATGQKLVKQYDEISSASARGAGGIEVTEPLVEFDKHPLTVNVPPKVMDSNKVTLFDLDRGDKVFSASLPSVCKELFENIKGCVLDYSENAAGEKVLLSDAIRYSIENGVLGQKLISKQGELSEDVNGTYLRITCGSSFGKSPGVPYVLEIWPAGHFSPVHNHGNANAVIKCLYGSLTVDVYNKQMGRDTPVSISTVEVEKDDVVWIDRNWYQTHKLHNDGTEYCATIQCYTYGASDTTYWPYFDFIADDETIDEFYPSSDYGFVEMRDLVMKEYTDYVHGLRPRKDSK